MPKPLPPPSLAPTQHLSPQALQLTVDRLFTPFLRPSRYQPQPSPPSLAASRLPPPAAEIDERPRYRVRRFRLWRDNAPTLRLAVLDPKRRRMSQAIPRFQGIDAKIGVAQLRRYQAFAIPNRSFPTKGSLAIKWTPPPRNPATSVPTHKPVGTAQYNTASHTMGPPAVPAKTPKWLRQAKYKRLLQNKYVLDQEYERRFRKGMSELMEWVLNFETENL